MHMSLGDSFGVAGLGMLLIFVELSLLAALTLLMSKIVGKLTAAPKTPPPADSSVPGAPSPARARAANQSAGEIDLYDVDDATAALVMATVADDLDMPVGQLRFKSIKQLDQEPEGSE